jgi:hypothetical protein
MGNDEKGIFVDSLQQLSFKNEGLKVPGARNGVTGTPITNTDNLSILDRKVNGAAASGFCYCAV